MQGDGNLVLYAADATAIWHSITADKPGAYTQLLDDGALGVYAASGDQLLEIMPAAI